MLPNSIKFKNKNELLNKFREPESGEENDPFDEIEINMLESKKLSSNPGIIPRIKKKSSNGTRNSSAGSAGSNGSARSGDIAISNSSSTRSSSKNNTLNQNRQLKQQKKDHKEISVTYDNGHRISKTFTESPKKTRLLNQFKEKNDGNDYLDPAEFQLNLDILSLKLNKKLSDERFSSHRNNHGENVIDPELLNKRIDSATFKQNFKLINIIGRGAYAVVHQVKYLKTNEFFAIKQLKIENEDKIKYLMEEIELMTILNHENIVNFYGYLRVEDNLNIVLEYCSNGSLRNKFKVDKNGLPENEIRVYVKQILQGLKYVHEQGLIHRDVKAANILLDSNHIVKLADFGVATRVIDDPNNTKLETNGSPYWMAPEVILLQGVFTSSDIWSLGATIIELSTTRPPFGEFNPMAACHAIGTHEEIPIPNNLSDNAVDFIEKCFQKSPSIRKSASELLHHQWFKMENEDFSKSHLINTNERESNDSQIRVEETGNNNLMKFQEKYNDDDDDDISGFEDFELGSSDDPKPLRISNRFRTDTDFDIDDSITNQSINNIDNKIEIKIKELVDRINKKNDDNNLEIFNDFNNILTELNLKDNKIMKNLLKNDFIFTIYLIMNNKALYHEKLKFNELIIQLVNIINIIFEIDFIGFKRFVSIGGLDFLLKIFIGQINKIHIDRGNKEFLTLISNITNNDELSKELSIINFPTYLIELFLSNENNDGIELVLINGLYKLFNNESISKKYLINVVGRNNEILEKLSYLILKSLNSISESNNDQLIEKILNIILQFEQVNISIKNIIINLRFLNNLLTIFNHDLIKFESKLKILRFINSISSNSKFIDQLNKLNCLGILIDETKNLMNDSSIINGNNFNLENVNDYRLIKSSSFILPILFNLCYLNNENQINLINYEFIPYLIELNSISKLEIINNEIIKILCEIINNYNINNNLNYFNNEFNKLNLILFYFDLFNNYKWQINCIDSIIKLIKYDETKENNSSKQIALRYLLKDNNQENNNNNEKDNIKQIIYKSIIISKNLDQFLEKLIELIDIFKNDDIKFRIFNNRKLIEYLINKFNLNKINNNNNNNIQENVLILKFFKSLIGLKETRSTKSYSKLIKELYKIKIDYDNDKSNLSNKSVVIDQLLIEMLLSKD